MGLKVFKECCQNCLLSNDRIVSPKKAKEILDGCAKEQSFFVCHKATMDGGKQIVCKNFYDKLGHVSQQVRIAERLGVVEFVEQKDQKKLTPYRVFNSKNHKS
jgi:hypothetical protein